MTEHEIVSLMAATITGSMIVAAPEAGPLREGDFRRAVEIAISIRAEAQKQLQEKHRAEQAAEQVAPPFERRSNRNPRR